MTYQTEPTGHVMMEEGFSEPSYEVTNLLVAHINFCLCLNVLKMGVRKQLFKKYICPHSLRNLVWNVLNTSLRACCCQAQYD